MRNVRREKKFMNSNAVINVRRGGGQTDKTTEMTNATQKAKIAYLGIKQRADGSYEQTRLSNDMKKTMWRNTIQGLKRANANTNANENGNVTANANASGASKKTIEDLIPVVKHLKTETQSRQNNDPEFSDPESSDFKCITLNNGIAGSFGVVSLTRQVSCRSTWKPEISERKCKELLTYLYETSIAKTLKWKVHQLETIEWMLDRIVSGVQRNQQNQQTSGWNEDATSDFEPLGGILALERGLGKTITSIAGMLLVQFLKSRHVAEFQTLSGPVLLVVPSSLLSHWEHELTDIANLKLGIDFVIYHGPARHFVAITHKVRFILTTYDCVVPAFKDFELLNDPDRANTKSKKRKRFASRESDAEPVKLQAFEKPRRNILFYKYADEVASATPKPIANLSSAKTITTTSKTSETAKNGSKNGSKNGPKNGAKNAKSLNELSMTCTGRRKFMAIILDEAQLISNPTTQRAKAVYSLSSDCRWALSGTPINNRAKDLASLAAYIEAQTMFTTDMERRFRVLSSRQVLAWRDRYMKILDKSVLKLENLYVYTYSIDMSTEEKEIYYERASKSIKAYRSFHNASDSFSKNSKRQDLLVWLLRLTQCASDSEMVRRSEDEKTRTMHAKVEKINMELAKRRASFDELVAERCAVDDDEIDEALNEWKSLDKNREEPTAESGEEKSTTAKKKRKLVITRVPDDTADSDAPDPDMIHSDTEDHYDDDDVSKPSAAQKPKLKFSIEEQRQKIQYQKLCIICDKRICILDADDFKQFAKCSHFLCLSCAATANSGSNTIMTDTVATFSLADCCFTCLEQRNMRRRVEELSTKTRAILELVQLKLECLASSSTTTLTNSLKTQSFQTLRHKKIVIFSRWKTYLKILMDLFDKPSTFKQNNSLDGFYGSNVSEKVVWVKYVTLFGDMNAQQRKTALSSFANDDNVTILFSTLQCGGLGLNLVQASMVILCDQWWNPGAEDQAFDRVYRMGQERPVECFYIKSRCGIEDALEHIKASKRTLVNDFFNTTADNASDASSSGNGLSDQDMTSVFRIIREDFEQFKSQKNES